MRQWAPASSLPLSPSSRARQRPSSDGEWRWGGLAQFNGMVLTASLPLDEVALLLPPPLAPAPTPRLTPRPLVFAFGEMSDGGIHFSGLDLSFGMRYRELAVLIPSVVHPDRAKPVTFAREMWADDPRPIAAGNWVYGLGKEQADFRWSGACFEVHVRNQCRYRCWGSLRQPSQREQPRLERTAAGLIELFAHPVLGRRASGEYVVSRFDWDLAAADLALVDARIQWKPRGARERVDLRPVGPGSIAVRGVRWRTSLPLPLTKR